MGPAGAAGGADAGDGFPTPQPRSANEVDGVRLEGQLRGFEQGLGGSGG